MKRIAYHILIADISLVGFGSRNKCICTGRA